SRGRARAAAARTSRADSAAAPLRRTLPSGSRTRARHSWPSRRLRVPAGRHRPPTAPSGTEAPRAPRPLRRRRQDRGGRRSSRNSLRADKLRAVRVGAVLPLGVLVLAGACGTTDPAPASAPVAHTASRPAEHACPTAVTRLGSGRRAYVGFAPGGATAFRAPG